MAPSITRSLILIRLLVFVECLAPPVQVFRRKIIGIEAAARYRWQVWVA